MHMRAFPSLTLVLTAQTLNIDRWFAKQLTLWHQPKHKCTELFTMRALALYWDAAYNYLWSNFEAHFLCVNALRCLLLLLHSPIIHGLSKQNWDSSFFTGKMFDLWNNNAFFQISYLLLTYSLIGIRIWHKNF